MSDTFVRSTEKTWDAASDAGVRRQVLGHGPDLMLVRVEFETGAVAALHHHPHRQVSYVSSGRFEVTVDDERTELGPGDCFFVTADRVHGVVALQGGTLDMVSLNAGILASQQKEFAIFDFPFMFATPQEADAVVDGPFGKMLLAKLDDKGIHGLGYWELGFRNITNSKRPIVKVEDIVAKEPS